MKVVINDDFGGFGLSDQAIERLIELGMSVTCCNAAGHAADNSADFLDFRDSSQGYENQYSQNTYSMLAEYEDQNKFRTDLRVLQVVEELGEEASGHHANLKVIEIPDDIEWVIDEYDGSEEIHEAHRSWS